MLKKTKDFKKEITNFPENSGNFEDEIVLPYTMPTCSKEKGN